MSPKEVRETIRRGLDQKRKVPPRRRLRHHVFWRHNVLGQYGFGLQWEDVVRLDQNNDSCWLICGDSTQPEFEYFVVPHVEGRRLIADTPLICKPRTEMSFRAATQNVNFRAASCELFAFVGNELPIIDYCNRADLFEKWIEPYWHLLEQTDPVDLRTKNCGYCRMDRLPDYGTERHDYQCRNGECTLMWLGDYWTSNERAVEQVKLKRREKGQPDSRGFWVFNKVTQSWVKWDGNPKKY